LASIRVAQSLWVRPARGRAPGRLVALNLQQNFVLRAGDQGFRVGETGAGLGFGWGPFGLSGGMQFDWSLRAFTLVYGNGNLRDARGDEAHGGLSLQRGAASERIRGGIDELFAAARGASGPGELF